MRFVLYAMVAISLSLLDPAQSKAQDLVRVDCVASDCLGTGWLARNLIMGVTDAVTCVEGDCRNNGWIVDRSSALPYFVDCKGDGCFTSGWRAFADIERTDELMEVTCDRSGGEQSCLTIGWDAQGAIPNAILPFIAPPVAFLDKPQNIQENRASFISCLDEIEGECPGEGWIAVSVGRAFEARCINNDCFSNGWLVSSITDLPANRGRGAKKRRGKRRSKN